MGCNTHQAEKSSRPLDGPQSAMRVLLSKEFGPPSRALGVHAEAVPEIEDARGASLDRRHSEFVILSSLKYVKAACPCVC